MNSTLNKISWALAITILILSLLALLLAVTDIWPGNPFQKHRLVVVMGSLTIGGAIRNAYVRRGENGNNFSRS